MDGLSQQDRTKRVRDTRRFDVVDNSMESLLCQVEAIAGFIRYYNLKGKEEGYFDRFLKELRLIREQGIKNHIPDGDMEPSQALLFTFLRQFHEVTEEFNRKWDDYIYWYLMDYLGVRFFVPDSHKVCLGFAKNTPDMVFLNKNLKFIPKGNYPNVPAYRLCEDTFIENISIEKLFSVHLSRQKNIFPAARLGFVTSLKIKDLLKTNPVDDSMFCEDKGMNYTHPLGFIITSPSFLLREGKRVVTMTFTAENTMNLTAENAMNEYEDSRFFENIFYICISVEEGWKYIPGNCYSFRKENDNYILVFTLPEEFPGTALCTTEVHKLTTEAPAVRIYLNYDAWLCPYSWLANLRFCQLQIACRVEGIKNVLVYNDLGKADCSKPFAPFGINTEKGGWFTAGNYEMAQKNTQSIDLIIDWGNLPSDATGMKSYYKGYGLPVDNTSFRVKADYLTDNQWKDAGEYPLFGTVADGPLEKETVIRGIDVKSMSQSAVSEEDYDYSIHSRDGFVKFTLQSPETGFGEKAYRNIFSGYFLEKALSKKKLPGYVQPNEPYKPIVEHIKLNYVSEEVIDFRKYTKTSSSAFYQISPFGYRQVYPGSKQHLMKALFSIDTDANILIGLRNVCKGSILSLYFNFFPLKKKFTLDEIPKIRWSLGNGYKWQVVPDGNMLQDKTMNLMQDGIMQFIIPNDLSDSLFDKEGLIWLRAGIKNEHAIPNLNKVYVNVAEVEAESGSKELYDRRSLSGAEWKAERQIPGVGEIISVESYHSRKQENRETCLMRVSEYAVHRGKAVSPRDYELMALQAFPYIAKVKCLPGLHSESGKKGVVTLVIIPRPKPASQAGKQERLLATSRQILRVEEFFKYRTSAYVSKVDVINPQYEEVLARCCVKFRNRLPSAYCRSRLDNLLDELIAPWHVKQELPVFDSFIDMSYIEQHIAEQDYVEEVKHLSFVVIGEKADGAYQLHEYGKEDNRIIRPTTPYAVFIPAKEHLINVELSDNFGINEMTIDDSFIVPD